MHARRSPPLHCHVGLSTTIPVRSIAVGASLELGAAPLGGRPAPFAVRLARGGKHQLLHQPALCRRARAASCCRATTSCICASFVDPRHQIGQGGVAERAKRADLFNTPRLRHLSRFYRPSAARPAPRQFRRAPKRPARRLVHFASRARPRRQIGQCGVAGPIERAGLVQTSRLCHLSAWSAAGSSPAEPILFLSATSSPAAQQRLAGRLGG
eukprot:COSAG04_NODE_6356_length_1348_cov_659.581265_1_plen_211_part_01